MCVSCVFLMFSGIHIQKAEVLSARFPKEYDHKILAAKHPKLCTYFIQNSVYLWFFHTSIHTYMHACTHAHLLMVWVFSKDMYKYKKYVYIYTYMCVSCVFLMFSRIHIQKAEVLSVRFPKEYDLKMWNVSWSWKDSLGFVTFYRPLRTKRSTEKMFCGLEFSSRFQHGIVVASADTGLGEDYIYMFASTYAHMRTWYVYIYRYTLCICIYIYI